MKWRSNSFYSIATAAFLVVSVTTLAQFTPPFGSFLILCSAGPILLLAISAIHWAVREKAKPGIAIPTALAIMLVYAILLCANTPVEPRTLTQDELEYIQLGVPFEDITREIGGGDWISDADAFTVGYEVEGEIRLVLVFEDGVHLSGATLHNSDGITTTMGTTPALGTAGQ
jgi:hypothetical protein